MGPSAGGETDVGEECSAEHRERKDEDHDVLLAAGSLTPFHSKERARFALGDPRRRSRCKHAPSQAFGERRKMQRRVARQAYAEKHSTPAGSIAMPATQPRVMSPDPPESRRALLFSADAEKRGATIHRLRLAAACPAPQPRTTHTPSPTPSARSTTTAARKSSAFRSIRASSLRATARRSNAIACSSFDVARQEVIPFRAPLRRPLWCGGDHERRRAASTARRDPTPAPPPVPCHHRLAARAGGGVPPQRGRSGAGGAFRQGGPPR